MASEDNKVVLHYPGGEYEMDIKQSTEGDSGFDIGKLRNETGLVTLTRATQPPVPPSPRSPSSMVRRAFFATAVMTSLTWQTTPPSTRSLTS